MTYSIVTILYYDLKFDVKVIFPAVGRFLSDGALSQKDVAKSSSKVAWLFDFWIVQRADLAEDE